MHNQFHKLANSGNGRLLGLTCDETGVHMAGGFALIEREPVEGGWLYRLRPIEDLNRALSAAYGADVDLGVRKARLERIAQHLARGELGLAQVTALQLRLLDLPDEAAVDRLHKAEQLLRFNANHDDRGRFASAPGATQPAKFLSMSAKARTKLKSLEGGLIPTGFEFDSCFVMYGRPPSGKRVIGIFGE